MQINTLLPTTRLVVLLREPASRAYSHFRMITGCRHTDASNDAFLFQEMAVREVKARCARAGFTSLTTGSDESPACLPRLHACGKPNFASDAACTRIAHKIYRDVPSQYTRSSASSSSIIERSIYGNSIRRMYAIGWGCDRVAIMVKGGAGRSWVVSLDARRGGRVSRRPRVERPRVEASARRGVCAPRVELGVRRSRASCGAWGPSST